MNADPERLIALQKQDFEGKRLRAELIEVPSALVTGQSVALFDGPERRLRPKQR